MKKLIIVFLCLCLAVGLLTVSASAVMELMGVEVNVDAPKAGEKPGDVAVSLSWSEVVDVRWEGLDENGCFIPGEDYTIYVDVALKEQYHSKYRYRSLEDGFGFTVSVDYVDHEAEILSLTPTTVSARYTFKGNGGVDFQADEYGTAVANQPITPRSVAKYTATMDMEIPEGTPLKVIRAHVPVTSKYSCHMVDYQGQVVYIFVSTNDATPVLRDVKVEGKLDPDNLPSNCVPDFGTAPELKDIAVSLVTLYSFDAKKGSAPEMSHSKNDNMSIDIEYSEEIVSKAYVWFTATVTYKLTNSRYYFADDVRLNIVDSDVGGEIISKSKDTLVAKYTVLTCLENPYSVGLSDDMNEYLEYLRGNASYLVPTMAKGKLYDPTGNAKLYSEPRATALAAGNAVPEEFYIHDVNFKDIYPDMEGEWYYVSDLKAQRGFVPAAYVTDITPYDAFEGAPGNNKRSPFEFAGGSGTLEDPYLIATADQLNAMRYGPSRHYKLIADIDLSDWGNWVPIGGSPAYGCNPQDSANLAQRGTFLFEGSLDGNGHVISGMTIVIEEETFFMTESGNMRAYGLFGTIGSGENAVIKNLGIVDFNIDVNHTNVANSFELFAGAFAGRNQGTDLVDCYSAGGKINISVNFGKDTENIENITVGGLMGECSGTNILRCYNTSDVRIYLTGSEDSWLRAAGIVAAMDLSHLDECWNSGDVYIEPFWPDQWWFDSFAGGLVTEVNFPEIPAVYHLPPELSSSIFDCYNTGTVKAGNVSGVFNYSAYDVHLRNCYNVGELIGNVETEKDGLPCTADYINPSAAVVPFGTEFINNCYGNGTSISGEAWRYSASLGRMILKNVPEDSLVSAPEHTHKYSSVVTAPTCTEEGYTTHSCSCGDSYTDSTVPAQGHKWDDGKVTTEPTTAAEGEKTFTCTVCKETRTEKIDKLPGDKPEEPKPVDNPFRDVAESHYFFEPVMWAVEKGVTSGLSATEFGPAKGCTRAQVVTFLWRAAGKPAPVSSENPFKDIREGTYYYDAVLWAVENGVTSGLSADTFGPDANCNRGQIVTFLWRAKGKPAPANDANPFTDVSANAYYYDAVLWAVEKGITTGLSADSFGPNSTCTRGQIVTFLYRAYN